MHVIIIPDKFKGTLTAPAAATAIAEGWRAVRPEDQIELLPMSDGGDGFGEILSGLLGAELQTAATTDAAQRHCEAGWWWHSPTQTALVESARVIGLAMLPPGRFHPFELDTRGLGTVLLAAAARGARRCLIGIGGSATNDGGLGLARSLGWKFLDSSGEEIAQWIELHSLARMVPPKEKRLFGELVVAVDVQNPLLGPQGCSRIYGPQKGLRPEDFALAEQCLGRLAEVVKIEFGSDLAAEPGSGAAGGLGFGLRCFAAARLEPGFELFSSLAHLPERLKAAQLVLTGEGAIDPSSLMGKGVGQLASLCRELGVPCIGLAGVVPDRAGVREQFAAVHAMAPDLTLPENARANATYWLTQLASQAARLWRP